MMTNKYLKNRAGFTLIEVLIALVILASGLFVLTSSIGSSAIDINKAQRMQEITYLLQNKMVEYEVKYRNKGFSEIEKKEEGKFDEFPEYTWRVEVQEFPAPDIKAILMSTGETQSDFLLNIMGKFTEIMEKHIREMKVTLVFNNEDQKNPREFFLTTLLVDFKTPLAF